MCRSKLLATTKILSGLSVTAWFILKGRSENGPGLGIEIPEPGV